MMSKDYNHDLMRVWECLIGVLRDFAVREVEAELESSNVCTVCIYSSRRKKG